MNEVCPPSGQGDLSFPADYGDHGSGFEYWLWWGHVATPDGSVYAFELTFFFIGPGERVDYSITDVSGNAFHAASNEAPGKRSPVPGGERFSQDGQQALGARGNEDLHIQIAGVTLDVSVRQVKPPVLTFDGKEGADHLRDYERQRDLVTGTLRTAGTTVAVAGEGVHTHAWANSPLLAARNTTWLALQLADGSEVMAWQWRPYPGGPVELQRATVTDPSCHTTRLAASDYALTPTGTWTRADRTCSYPSTWTFRIKDRSYRVSPLVADQEVRPAVSPGTIGGNAIPYWEGLARVDGAGRGWAV